MVSNMKTIDAETLMTTVLPPTKFVVDRLLPEGLHILAGAPKVGKSWLALWLCLCVAKGESVWDFATTKGAVLYLCLEDSLTRIQNRLFQITEDAPDTLHFATLAGSIGGGLEDQLKGFLAEHPGTALVVIDTLQKVRQPGENANPYASDYRDITALKRLADECGIAILLIHHLRKMNDEDPLNMISGTTGISGATDSSFVLKERKRGSGEATLYCTGRDIEYRELPLRFQKDTHTWVLTEPVEEDAPAVDPEVSFLSAFLKGLHSAAPGDQQPDDAGSQQDLATGWERERAEFFQNLHDALRQPGRMARDDGTVRDEAQENSHLHRGDLSGPLRSGLYGLAALAGLMDDDEDPEEKRRRIQAQEEAENFGAALGIVAGIAVALTREEQEIMEQESCNEYCAEQELWQQTMGG